MSIDNFRISLLTWAGILCYDNGMKSSLPKTNAQIQRERYDAMREAANAAGWSSWAAYCTAVIHGAVRISRPPRRWISARGKLKANGARPKSAITVG
jgi:hypothetical protein